MSDHNIIFLYRASYCEDKCKDANNLNPTYITMLRNKYRSE